MLWILKNLSEEGTNNLGKCLLPVKEIYMKRMAILNIFVLALLCIIGCSDSNDGSSSTILNAH